MIDNSILAISHIKMEATRYHAEAGHRYGDHPYDYHLNMVYQYALKYGHLISEDYDFDKIIAACWLHDTIEDCRKTYNDIKQLAGEDVAELVYALTNEKGRTRADRANEKYYSEISKSEAATFVKVCDRLANVKHSVDTNSSMMKAYKKENNNFNIMLFKSRFKEMFVELNSMCS